MRITNNTILITGGSVGIGLALAKRFLLLNNKVIITGGEFEKLEGIKKDFPELIVLAGDLTEQNSINDLVLFIEQEYPETNILVNSAAIQYNYDIMDDPDFLRKANHEIYLSLIAPLNLTTLMLPILLKNKNSAIVNASIDQFIGSQKSAAIYCAVKAGIRSFTKSLKYQLEDTQVKVFEIIPSSINTSITAGRDQSLMEPDKLVDQFITDFYNDRNDS
ncbi:SDR family oxidoreductase [Chryseobacterium lathyri]|uniref:Short-subunit dehydrogenase involved in D-alanine esterification of teichoic acids n=1 Tax=Chryseobacterium lathyri TaxID=395933 RepID=A0ABT9SRR3_9FLAO|nr:SDR family NAD(P)-dependent oxidoreductase [Chryseobacterium lathyri]MDP9962129.1 short-subunit dehydrogenase involved in D-alanine esterification of teichoic acids [Chryseobacterium lathyri]